MKPNHRKTFTRPGRNITGNKNPLFTKPSWKIYVINRFSFFTWLLLLIFVSVLYGIFHSSFFTIATVQITGTTPSIATEVHNQYVIPQLDETKLLLLTQRNLLGFNTKQLHQTLADTFSFESMSVEKDFPSTLRLTLVERQPELVWQTKGTQYLIDSNGIAVSIFEQTPDVPATEGEEGNTDAEETPTYPVIVDQSNEEVQLGQEILSADKISFTLAMHSKLQEIVTLTITGYTIAHRQTTQIDANTDQGYQIYFETSKNVDHQIEKLSRVINNGTLVESAPQEYVDLRIGDRIYFK